MGPSGSGKTTLLNLLSGRARSSGSTGTITYNDQPYNKSLKKRIGFVLQDDVVFSHLTVKETLTYAARLRLSNTLTKRQMEERAMDVISELGLERCQDSVTGGALLRGISGGERKRVCIGNEILLNPSLLFLDEPTSGLDSTSALRIVQVLQKIAQGGKTVVTTIHQPSSRLFSKFDKLILLAKGSSLYSGKASEAMLYFSSIGCSPLIAMNPAEFLIDLANGNVNDKSIPFELKNNPFLANTEFKSRKGEPSAEDVHEYLAGAYHHSKVAMMEKKLLTPPAQVEKEVATVGRASPKEWGASWWDQFSILFWRDLKERRHDYLSWLRATQVIATSIILGLLWWNSDSSTPQQLQDQAGLLFFISVFWGFFPVFTAIFTFPQEKAMLTKERSVDMYRLSAYFMARNMSDLPLDLILPIVFMLIVYFMAGLKQSIDAFFLSMLIVLLSIVAAQGLGLAIGAAFMDIMKATTLASVTVMTFMLAGGYFVQRIPPFISWIRNLSFAYHTYRLLLKIQYGCSGSNHLSRSCNSPFIKRLGNDNSGKDVAPMVAMIFGYRLLAYYFLRRMKLRTLN
ncbi:ABC transporter G family member 22-like [Aristolochia californica]|uniref:ABC transporter G family member 22-like n=1 Tax=Aristolochia californica TaxID=171875 RepID=UPI0035DC0831